MNTRVFWSLLLAIFGSAVSLFSLGVMRAPHLIENAAQAITYGTLATAGFAFAVSGLVMAVQYAGWLTPTSQKK